MPMIANVIINVSSSNVDQKYDYLVPKDLEPIILVGTRVKVPFGKGDRTIMGYVLGLSENTVYSQNMKEIIEVLDGEPILTDNQIKLASYIAFDTLSPLIRVLNLMIPKALQLKTKKYLSVDNYQALDADLALKFGGKQIIEYTNNLNIYNNKIRNEIKKGNLHLVYDALDNNNIKQVTKYYVNPDCLTDRTLRLNEHVRDVLHQMLNEKPLEINQIADRYELSIYRINNLIKHNCFFKTLEKVSRVKNRNIQVAYHKYQEIDYQEIDKDFSKIKSSNNQPILWIPKDNKETEMMIFKIINENLNNHKNTLIICPDILLTYKYSSLIRKETNLDVACINSNIGNGEIFDYYQEIKENQYPIMVTSPVGSLFPYENLGTIIMMNTENDNYFNDQSPRYDLKKVMIKKAQLEKINLVMHSFSPTVVEYCRGLQTNYLMIDNRESKNTCQNIEIIDLKEELIKGNTSYISDNLLKQIRVCKARNKQSVLIINNRNYSSSVICRTCGYVFRCPKCELTLKYSKKKEQLVCPACSYRIPYQKVCPSCSSSNLLLSGVGIEQIEEELKERLPNFHLTLIDNPDFTSFQEKLIEIEDQATDIIITTDTFARSIYNQNIGLVGVINIDSIAMSNNYNANERAYNLLVNTSALLENDRDGRMIIQTYHTENYILNDFITGDYKEYLKKEISNRKLLKNEPFYFINRILIKGGYQDIFTEADLIKKILKELLKEQIYIIGPSYNYSEMAAQLIIKHRLENISEYYQKIYSQYQNSNTIKVIFDKYPKYL